MIRLIGVTVALLGLTACASINPASRLGSQTSYLKFSPSSGSPYCGRCDTAELYVSEDGHAFIVRGRWSRSGEIWQERVLEIDAEPDAVIEFYAYLSQFKPDEDTIIDEKDCSDGTRRLSHGSYWNLIWHDQTSEVLLSLHGVCRTSPNAQLKTSIRNAPSILGLEGLQLERIEP